MSEEALVAVERLLKSVERDDDDADDEGLGADIMVVEWWCEKW